MPTDAPAAAIRDEDVRIGAAFTRRDLRWKDGTARKCLVLAMDRERVTWAPLRQDGSPLASRRTNRDDFSWIVSEWML